MTEHEKRDFYYPSEIAELLKRYKRPKSSFYRLVGEGKIHKTIYENEEVYNGPDVDSYLEGRLITNGRRKRAKPLEQGSASSPMAREFIAVDKPAIRLLTNDDIGMAYKVQFDELGIEHAASPMSMRIWQAKSSSVYWVLNDPVNSKIIWAILGVIPLNEILILRLLREEITLPEIEEADVLSYQAGQAFTCYISGVASVDAPSNWRRESLVLLIQHFLSFLCQEFPNIEIKMLYTLAQPSLEETPLLRALGKYHFGRRRDISAGAWELPLNEYNYSDEVQQLQKCIQQKKEHEKIMLIIDQPLEKSAKKEPPFKSPLKWRRAETKEDVAAMVQIGAEIFVPPGVQPSISNEYQIDVWYSWLTKNPEIFHVVEIDGDIIGYISLIPLPMDIIDKIMRGAHPTTIVPDDVLIFEPDKPVDTYVHLWGTTTRLTEEQKNKAGMKMLFSMREMFNAFARRGIEVRSVYTRSNKADGIRISKHLGLEEVVVPGVTDASDEHDRKHIFCLNIAESTTSDFAAQYREALQIYRENRAVNSNS